MAQTEGDLMRDMDRAILRRSAAVLDYHARSLSIQRQSDAQIIAAAKSGTLRGEKLA